MNVEPLLDAPSAHAIGSAWLYHALEPVSAFGKRSFEQLAPFRPGQERQAAQRAAYTAALAEIHASEHIEAMREHLRSCPDPLPALSRAAMGELLDDANFLELLRFLDAARHVDLLDGNDSINGLALKLEPGRAGKFGFYLADTFDPALAAARSAADGAQRAYEVARATLAQRVYTALGREDTGSEEFIVMRDAIAALPRGIRVLRESPAYYLCELELDEPALQALQARDSAAGAVDEQEQKLRSALSDDVRAALGPLESLLIKLAQADIDLAQARFAQQFRCTVAGVTAELRITFEDAVYLPLQAQLQAQGRNYAPVSLDLREPAALTGPNMGGKSAALRTCGFIALLVAFGIPVPAARVECALFDRIAWLGIVAQDEGGGLLSSFASEVVRLSELLARPRERMLLLVDEFARTTTPHEGSALLVALLRAVRRRGALAFAATHLSDIARRAKAPHFAVRGLRELPARSQGDLAQHLEALARSMDYSIAQVDEQSVQASDAIALAELLGLDEDIIADAKEQAWTR